MMKITDLGRRKIFSINSRFSLILFQKKDPLRNTLSRLVIHATFIFHDEDFNKIEMYLQEQMNLCPNAVEGFSQYDNILIIWRDKDLPRNIRSYHLLRRS
jgi:hypothetical protein